MVSWLAVSFVPDLDAPQNLGFGNISAPRKRLNCFQVVWWTKLLGGAAQFSWTYDYCQCRHHSWCSVFTFVFGILIIVFALRCSHRMLNVRTACLKGGKMAKDQLIFFRMYCNWGSHCYLTGCLDKYIKYPMTKSISSLSWEPPPLAAARKTTRAAGYQWNLECVGYVRPQKDSLRNLKQCSFQCKEPSDNYCLYSIVPDVSDGKMPSRMENIIYFFIN